MAYSGTYNQTAFRFRNDDGDDETATWKAALNTDITQTDAANQFRLRIGFAGITGTDNNTEIILQRSLNSGTWTTVNSSSAVAKGYASSNITNEETTPQQITSGTFREGFALESSLTTGLMGVAASEDSECEFCVELVPADIANGDTIDFRITLDGVTASSYTEVPRVTIGSGTVTVVSPLKTFTRTGNVPTKRHVVTSPLGTYTLTGNAPTHQRIWNVPAGAYTLTGNVPTKRHIVTSAVGGYALSGGVPQIFIDVAVIAPAGAYTLTGFSPTKRHVVTSPAGTYALAGSAPLVAVDVFVLTGAGAFTLLGSVPTASITVPASVLPPNYISVQAPVRSPVRGPLQ